MPHSLILILVGLACFICGGVIAFFLRHQLAVRRFHKAEIEARELLSHANDESKGILLHAKEGSLEIKSGAEKEARERRSELQKQERRLIQKEENLERKLANLEQREQTITTKDKELEKIRSEAAELRNRQITQLEVISRISSSEAREMLLERIESEIQEEASCRVRRMEEKVKEECEEKSRCILAQAIQRCTTEVVSESTVSTVSLPSDEIKGRLIGREGRNIRALEHATGVELIIDDTPESVTLSCFDPVRREIARLALNRLILDGRIHPARIEETVQKVREEMEVIIQKEGEQAALKAKVSGLHPELIRLLGRLKYRFSYGQNVLTHSVEVALLSAIMASELKANVDIARRAGLLHDIGKAVDFEMEGSHAHIGGEIVRQWEKSPLVAKIVASHHEEVPITSVEGFIVSSADAVSGARPGARRESLEKYLKRLEELENIAKGFSGVEKTYAVQAGREIRVMVKPGMIDDISAMRLARDIAKRIEDSLSYPGQIRVTVIRETRAVEYAK